MEELFGAAKEAGVWGVVIGGLALVLWRLFKESESRRDKLQAEQSALILAELESCRKREQEARKELKDDLLDRIADLEKRNSDERAAISASITEQGRSRDASRERIETRQESGIEGVRKLLKDMFESLDARIGAVESKHDPNHRAQQ